MSLDLAAVFEETYRELRPRAPMPDPHISFHHFAGLRSTIRLRDKRLLVRLSDLFEGAPAAVLGAIFHLLLARLYRKPVDAARADRYRRYVRSQKMHARMLRTRESRGRKHISGTRGEVYDLEEIFEDLNCRFFHGLMGRPRLTWSRNHARRLLGHYDPAHNTIVVSRVFDSHKVPRYALEYLLFHEMLHLRHPVRLRGGRRCVHSPEFQAAEKQFPRLAEARKCLKSL
ncbi:MAG: SprT-like domain-containing protein [Acidobacteria bacterium]|nr:SprT-like domain-containing protein [Acidobacteriota bacterium]